MTTSPFRRVEMLDRLANEQFDVLVIGGGITGAGVALDAASRGLRTALVERDDFASGTSSKSSKLVHGGLRYLQSGDVKLVYQALRERQRLLNNAPHLVSVLPFLIPILTRDGVVSKKIARMLGLAMWMYDLTGGLRIGKRHRRLDADATMRHFPTLPPDKVSFGYLYYDASADDARLTLTIARTAAEHGAAVANRCSVTGFLKEVSGRVCGAEIDTGESVITLRARVVIAATGVWSDEIRHLDEGTNPDTIRPAKGVHITIPWELVKADIAVVFTVPADKRRLFIVPWGERPDGSFDHAYVGTTDTDYTGPLDDPQCTDEDIEYILEGLNHSLTTTVTRNDITGVWAGLRPLVKAASSGRTADLSRQHQVTVSDAGVIGVTGGKLTTYREMASDAVDEALNLLDGGARCRTRNLKLMGSSGIKNLRITDPHFHLAHRFGSAANEVLALIDRDPALGTQLVPGLPYYAAEAVYAVRCEMANTVDDVLMRRTRAHLQDRAASMNSAAYVAELLAPELGWDADETARQVQHYLALCEAEISAAQSSKPIFTPEAKP